MLSWSGKNLTIGNLNVKLPIIQGGMGIGISLSGLASAVANQGGIGVIATPGIGITEPDVSTNYIEANNRGLRKEIRKARELTKGIIGVNIMVALSNFGDLVKTAVDEGIDVIFSGAGLPLNLPSFIDETKKTKLVPIVSSARAAVLIAKKWIKKYDYAPDAIVIEGPMAGGHLGFTEEQIDDPKFTIENLFKEIYEKVKEIEVIAKKPIPIIVGGGIYTGKDIHKFIKLGAAGVQMGTRFVTTNECDASIDFKKTYIDCKEESIGIIKSPVGMPGRAIVNKYVEDISIGKKMPFKCPFHCIVTCDYKNSPYCIASALINAKNGKMQSGFAFAGKNAYRAEKIVSVEELVQNLITQYDTEVNNEKLQSGVTFTDNNLCEAEKNESVQDNT